MGSGASSKKYKSTRTSNDASKSEKLQDLPSSGGSSPRKKHVRLRGHRLRIEAPKNHPRGWKTIERTRSFGSIYTLGGEVMPSTNYGTKVLYAKRLLDAKEVVVKVREKAKAFRDSEFENEWRNTTETILNLPRHDGITEVFEVLEDDEAYYVIMERAGGEDLFETLVGPLRPTRPESQVILKQLLSAIEALHAKGYIHRDLKLENVMVDRTPKTPIDAWEPTSSVTSAKSSVSEETSTPSVKLIDFDTVEEVSPVTPKKRSNLVYGTDMYIPVEAYSGNYSPASDIFSIGVIAYKLLTGRYPFSDSCFPGDKGDNIVGSPAMIATQRNLKACEVNWSLPPFDEDADAKDLVRSMLNVADELRPTAAEALGHTWFATTIIA